MLTDGVGARERLLPLRVVNNKTGSARGCHGRVRGTDPRIAPRIDRVSPCSELGNREVERIRVSAGDRRKLEKLTVETARMFEDAFRLLDVKYSVCDRDRVRAVRL